MRTFSPGLSMGDCVGAHVPKKRYSRGMARPRVKDADFRVLRFGEDASLLALNYKVKQLKAMCSHHGLRVSGNKDELKKRLGEFLKLSGPAATIQRGWRTKMLRMCNRLRGPAFLHRGRAVNETDFFSMSACADIPPAQFFSVRDDSGTTYAFDILSMWSLLRTQGSKASNPYTRQAFPEGCFPALRRLVRLSRLLGDTVVTTVPPPPKESIESQCSSLFHDMMLLNVGYPSARWFTDLGRQDTVRYLRELRDIWEYRVGLDRRVQREICPPDGRPFRHVPVGIERLPLASAREAVLRAMQRLVGDGVNQDSQRLGAMYVLCALTLVSPPAAQGMPHLYASVAVE